jgi:hypothetical protein
MMKQLKKLALIATICGLQPLYALNVLNVTFVNSTDKPMVIHNWNDPGDPFDNAQNWEGEHFLAKGGWVEFKHLSTNSKMYRGGSLHTSFFRPDGIHEGIIIKNPVVGRMNVKLESWSLYNCALNQDELTHEQNLEVVFLPNNNVKFYDNGNEASCGYSQVKPS